MTRAVLFDFDGLLVDTGGLSLKMYQELLHEYGYEVYPKSRTIFLD